MSRQSITNLLLVRRSDGAWILITGSSSVQIFLLPAENAQFLLWTIELVAVNVHHQHVVRLHVGIVSPVDGGVGVVVVVGLRGVAIGVVVVRVIVIGHISVHFVMRVMMVWVMK